MKMTHRNSKIFFFIMFLIVIVLSLLVVRPYISIVFLAFIIAVVFKPIYDLFLKIFRGRESIATLLTVLVFLFVIIIPIFMLLSITLNQVKTFYDDINDFVSGNDVNLGEIIDFTNKILEKIPFTDRYIEEEDILLLIKNNVQPLINFMIDSAVNVGKGVFGYISYIPKFVVFLFVLTGFIPKQEEMLERLKKLSPLDDDIDSTFINRFVSMAKSMIRGSFVIAIMQGIISGFVMYLVGVPYSLFWTIIAIFLSIIPLGAGIINFPIGVVLIILGNYWQGALIILNHFIVITNIDNILRPKLVSKDAELNPILTLLGALGGVTLFGFWGVIFGPIIMIFLITMIEVYMKYYQTE